MSRTQPDFYRFNSTANSRNESSQSYFDEQCDEPELNIEDFDSSVLKLNSVPKAAS